MKISRNWLNNYIISRKTDSELVDAFTSLGLECTIQKNSLIDSNIVVGKVKNCIKITGYVNSTENFKNC